jgi:hypothetical protein
MNSIENDEVLITGYKPAAQFLTEHGFPISTSLLSKIGAPSIAQGPEVAGYWNNRPAFRPSSLLTWARGRLKPNRPMSTAATSTQPASEPTSAEAPTPRRKRGRPRKPAPPAVPFSDVPPLAPADATPGGDQ